MSRRPGARVARDRSHPTLPAPPAAATDHSTDVPQDTRPAPEAPGQRELKVAALYARVSTEKQEQEETIQSQLAALRHAAGQRGYLVSPDDEFIEGVSKPKEVR